MNFQQTTVAVVMAALTLSSCQSKIQNNPLEKSTAVPETNQPVYVNQDAGTDLHECINNFTESIQQHFVIEKRRKTTITAKQGLRITVDPAVLETEDGAAVTGEINVSIIELTNSADLFKANATTLSNGMLLASGGSYFIGMECNEKKLRLRKAATMQVDFPLIKNEEMQLFYGERDENNAMNWKERLLY